MQQIRTSEQNKKTPDHQHLLICKFDMVQEAEKSLHEISGEIARWRDILAVPYQEYLLSR